MALLSRRRLMGHAATLGVAMVATGQDKAQDPWTADRLMEPRELARILKANDREPIVISVAFPVLYRQRHIIHALPAGPTSKPEGLSALHAATATLPKDADIVIYCGCCPMEHCPNIRPAYTALERAGFRNVHVLNLPTNLHADWDGKGYPVEPSA
jgi:thiosulfate/3-mercaptopyruvate sulfurtransferase